MRICVVGGGAREHALAWRLGADGHSVVVAPGNPGIPGSVPDDPLDVEADLVVVGPEEPLVAGLADRLRARGRLVFGPGADGAQLEGSKRWMKALLDEAGVPTARYASFDEVAPALAFLHDMGPPFVVKTDGLAAGKGVLVTSDRAEAADDVAAKLARGRVVVEEGMTGPELSVLAVCDGSAAVALAPARDHKRVGDGDVGPNTGGMGAYSPVAGVDAEEAMEVAVRPTLAALARRGVDYRGVLYAGLMLTADGVKVVEFNVRFGDPEAQVVLPRTTGDLGALLAEAAAGRLRGEPGTADLAAVTVACAVEGYPDAPRTGDPIEGLVEAAALDGVEVFCAGVDAGPGGGLVTAGGRVLSVTGLAPTLEDARARAYEGVARLSWPGLHHRTDIGADASGTGSAGEPPADLVPEGARVR